MFDDHLRMKKNTLSWDIERDLKFHSLTKSVDHYHHVWNWKIPGQMRWTLVLCDDVHKVGVYDMFEPSVEQKQTIKLDLKMPPTLFTPDAVYWPLTCHWPVR